MIFKVTLLVVFFLVLTGVVGYFDKQIKVLEDRLNVYQAFLKLTDDSIMEKCDRSDLDILEERIAGLEFDYQDLRFLVRGK